MLAGCPLISIHNPNIHLLTVIAAMKNKCYMICLLLFSSYICATAQLSLTSGPLQMVWAKQADGWHITYIDAGGKTLANPSGYYTIILIR
jgi:hypothetical protein